MAFVAAEATDIYPDKTLGSSLGLNNTMAPDSSICQLGLYGPESC